ncbi:MAG: lysogenization regulator HflD [Gammaproteobacteria bacterium]|nr:MAG: lysogenization regulator HflD [Gammaproteobacteria bacterium]
MTHSKFDQTLALAGIYQTASLVKQIANKGIANSAHIESSVETLFRFDADNVEDVYGSVSGVNHGVKILYQHLSERGNRDIEITKYVVSLVMLQKKLTHNTTMLDDISKRLNAIETQMSFFSLNHENTFAKLGQLYQDSISTLGQKIIVNGEQPHLNNAANANKIRALLLAGIRSAVLWHQCGGSRWQFLFGRKAYVIECEKILRRF